MVYFVVIENWWTDFPTLVLCKVTHSFDKFRNQCPCITMVILIVYLHTQLRSSCHLQLCTSGSPASTQSNEISAALYILVVTCSAIQAQWGVLLVTASITCLFLFSSFYTYFTVHYYYCISIIQSNLSITFFFFFHSYSVAIAILVPSMYHILLIFYQLSVLLLRYAKTWN